MRTLANKRLRADVAAGILAGVLGLSMIVVIWVNLVFPAPIVSGGGTILTGSNIPLKEHEWGFNQFAKGGPEICANVTSQSITVTLTNTGVNLHGFQIVRTDTGAVVGGLNKTDLLRPGEVRHIKIDISHIAPGSYYYICPVSGHRQKGMIAPFVVQSGCCC
jgi:FtsP/CotA-like multicopper oxidase with cupredoxin domain